MKSSDFEALITFQSQCRSCSHFFASGKLHYMSCICPLKLYRLVKTIRLVITQGDHFNEKNMDISNTRYIEAKHW